MFVAMSTAATDAAEDNWYWNVTKYQGTATLYSGSENDSGEITDATYAPFSCPVRSGKINVGGVMNDAVRLKMAEAIKNDKQVPPYVDFGPAAGGQTGSLVLDLSYSAMDGWLYRFQIEPDHLSLRAFRRTGRFVFHIGGARIQIGEGQIKGLENIGKFIDECKQRKR